MGMIENVCQILKDFDLEPEVVDNAIQVRYEMKHIVIRLEDKEDADDENAFDKYLNVAFPAFYRVNDEDVADVLVVCNKANRELRQIKTFLSEDLDAVSSSFEFWYLNNDDLRNSLKFALYMISHIRSRFYRELRNTMTESQPIPDTDDSTKED